MDKQLLSLVRQSVDEGYLPEDWHGHKNDVVKTGSGFFALLTDCIIIDDDYYHEVQDEESIVFDEVNDRYVLEDDCIRVYRGRLESFLTRGSDSARYFEYEDEYYTHEGLEANGLVVTSGGTVARSIDVHYWESDGEYHFEPEDDEEIWGYHNGPCPPDYRERPEHPGIGFEIEKGGYPVFCGYADKEELFDATGCVMEEDSTVDWELKTPVYPLFSERIEKEWLPAIARAINAEDHDDAGGHIHLSLPPKSGNEMFDYCRPYMPLFMAMYPRRLEQECCKAKHEKSLKRDSEKYQAIKIWENRIELRFPAKVYDMRALRFRLDFCRLMISKECKNILSVTRSAFDQNTRLGSLIRQEYDGKEYLLLTRLIDVAKTYFNTNLRNEKCVENLLVNLKTKKSCVLQS